MSDQPTQASGSQAALIASARRQIVDLLRRAGGRALPGARRVAERPLGLPADAFAGYTLIEEIHRGGQGVVYKALQESTRRHVAIKVLRDGHLLTPAEIARFEQEVQVLGRLRHANIVRIFDSSAAAGRFYYVMDYIPGLPLDAHVRKVLPTLASPDDVIRLFLKVCDAVWAAHLRGIIHRDLKPGNIRVDPDGEPFVLDFGLSKLTGAERSDVTHSGQFVGSLPWAAPEQVEARLDAIDLRTDVYSLGVLLYHLLTGRFPFRMDDNPQALLAQIAKAEPTPPRTHVPGMARDLDTIILKCLQKDPERRYQSAGELARDLRRYLAGEPIEARRDSTWYTLRKRLQRYRVAAVVATLALLLAAALLAGAVGFYYQERQRRAEAERARVEADRLRAAAGAAEEEARRQTAVARAVNEFFSSQVLVQASPERMGRDVLLRDVLVAAADHAASAAPDDPWTAAEIHYALSVAFRDLGDPARSERHARQAHEIARDAFGEASDLALRCANNHGEALHQAGRLQDAAGLLERTLEARIRVLGRESTDTLGTRSSLGWTYLRLGRAEEALPLLREAYEAQRRLRGPEDKATLINMHNLATALTELHRLDEAIPLRAAHAAAAERVLGPDDQHTLRSRGQLALLKSWVQELDEAETIFRDVLERQRVKQGPAHPTTLATLNNLATLLSRQQRRPEAIALLREGLNAAEPALGSGDSVTVTMKSNLGELCRREGRFAEALPWAEAALAGAREYLPPEHHYIGLYSARLGYVLADLGRDAEAERLLLEGHRICRAAVGEADKDTVEAATAIEALYERLQQPGKLAAWRASSGATTRAADAP